MYTNFPQYYRPTYYPHPTPEAYNQFNAPYQQQQPNSNDMIWVLNETEAASYPVAPNASVFLWDKNAPILYVKSNKNGVPSFQVYELKERNQKQEHDCQCEKNFVSVDLFNALDQQVKTLAKKVETLSIGKETEINE